MLSWYNKDKKKSLRNIKMCDDDDTSESSDGFQGDVGFKGWGTEAFKAK